jgi:hypothetical protein
MTKANNIYNKTTETRYFAITDETIKKLSKLACLTSWHLYFILTRKCSFRNGLVGVFSELTIYRLAEELSSQLGKDFQVIQIKRALQKLEKNDLVKVLHNKPLIVSLPQAEFSEPLDTMAQALAYIDSHLEEFNLVSMHRRREEFFAAFNYTPSKLPVAQESTDKAKALDKIINSRPSRAPASLEEKAKAKAWHEEIEEEERAAKKTKTTTQENGNEEDFGPIFDPFV